MATKVNQGGTVPSFSPAAILMAGQAIFDADSKGDKLIITLDGNPYDPMKDPTPNSSVVKVEGPDIMFIVHGGDFRRIQRVVYELERERDKKGVWM